MYLTKDKYLVIILIQVLTNQTLQLNKKKDLHCKSEGKKNLLILSKNSNYERSNKNSYRPSRIW
jgi:hypothetical protein